jgi:endoglucanase
MRVHSSVKKPAVHVITALICAIPMSGVLGISCVQAIPKTGDTVLDERPALPQDSIKWKEADWTNAVPEGEDGKTVLRIDVPTIVGAGTGGSVQNDVNGVPIKLKAGRYELERPLDLKDIRGWRVDVVANIRTQNVPQAELPWEGIRLGINIRTPPGNYGATAYGLPVRNEWHQVAMRHVRIPEDATAATLYAGLISTSGSMWIDDVRIILTEPPLSQLAAMREPYVQKTEWRGHNGANPRDNWIRRFATEWNANFLKHWIVLPSPDLPEAEYFAALENKLATLDDAIRQAEAAGIKIVPQVSTKTASWSSKAHGDTDRVYLEPAVTERFVQTWRVIAERYKGREGIQGYDLKNESVLRAQPAAGCPDYEGLIERTAKLVNAIDPDVRIIVQPEEWWGVTAFTKLRPINAKNVTYSVHMYSPFELTHQGLRGRKSEGISYPSTIKGRIWNKETLRQVLKPARDFQMAYGVPMQVGEFSSIRWAPDGSSARWLKDVIDIFEQYGWDWMYHGVLDWDGWSLELGEDPTNLKPLTDPPAAKQVILTALAKNARPIPVASEVDVPLQIPFKAGEQVFKTTFDDTNQLRDWEGLNQTWLQRGYKETTSLRMERDKSKGAGVMQVRIPLPVERLRGQKVNFRAVVKATDVAQPQQSYNGVKVMLQIENAKGTQYPQAGSASGTFDWKTMQGNAFIPTDAIRGWLILGLQDTTGTVWFDEVEVSVGT